LYKYLNLIIKNLGRNKLRTTLTALAVMVLVSIYSIVSVVTAKVNSMIESHSSQTRLIVRERWVTPSEFPSRYVPKIADIEGVEDWTVWNFYFGRLGDVGTGMGGVATRMDNVHVMHPNFEQFDVRLLKEFEDDKTAVLVGRELLEKHNLKVGQRITLTGISPLGKDLTFNIVGALDSDVWSQTIFFRRDYFLRDDEDDLVNVMWIRVNDAETGQRVAAEIEAMFENSPVQMRVETEAAGIARISGRITSTVAVINFITTVLLIDMVMILANSISMTVRERRKEMAILKVLGFTPRFVAGMVVGEAVLVGGVSGTLGAAISYYFCELNTAGQLPFRIDYLLHFPVTSDYVPYGLVIGVLVGFAGSVLPALSARNVHVAEAFAAGE